jgi:threonine aldolase
VTIDLRSDTLTRPTDAMRRAMTEAEVGDDVYSEDPTVVALQQRVAGMFGKEDALFTPTGSMANVLAVASLVQAGQEVLCEASAHIARAELGAHGALTGLRMRTWRDPRGQVDHAALESMFAPDMGPFFVRTAAVSGREHPQLRRRRRPSPGRPRDAPELGDVGRHRGAPRRSRGSGTPTSRPASPSRRTARVPT